MNIFDALKETGKATLENPAKMNEYVKYVDGFMSWYRGEKELCEVSRESLLKQDWKPYKEPIKQVIKGSVVWKPQYISDICSPLVFPEGILEGASWLSLVGKNTKITIEFEE